MRWSRYVGDFACANFMWFLFEALIKKRCGMVPNATIHHKSSPNQKTLLMLTKHPLARVSATNHKNQLIRQVRNSGNGTHESNETSQASYLFLGFILWFLRQHDKALVMPHPQLLAPSQASSPPEGHRQQSTTQTARILKTPVRVRPIMANHFLYMNVFQRAHVHNDI